MVGILVAGKMLVNRESVVFWLPLFLVIAFGREFRGLGVETIIINISLMLSLLFNKEFHGYLMKSIYARFFLLGLVAYCVFSFLFSYYYDADGFKVLSYFEDVYALLMFLYFYILGVFFSKKGSLALEKVFLLIAFSLFLNLLMTVVYYGASWSDTFFQRLWNPYLISILPVTYFASKNVKSYLWLIPFSIIFYFYASSFQMASIFILLTFSIIFGNRLFSLFGNLAFGGMVLLMFVAAQIFFVSINPIILADFDHNFGVRAVFWREALEAFFIQPYGFHLGVSIVSGDMSSIGESMFHGGREYEDLGVHSGFWSLVYKLGVFSLPILVMIFKPAFRIQEIPAENVKGYVIVMFACLLSFFSNDSFFTPHFNISLALLLGFYSAYRKDCFE